jgi:hypothetical protein
MNQAAVPAEAFNPEYAPDSDDALFVAAARNAGYPNDIVWVNEWSDFTTIQFNNWQSTFGGLSGDQLREKYTRRWTQVRTPDKATPWIPDVIHVDGLPHGGPWRGIFAGNLGRTRMVNTFSSTDEVLGSAWLLLQIKLKPFMVTSLIAEPGEPSDNRFIQYWGHLRHDLQALDAWPETRDPQVWASQRQTVRQWAELAEWFPSTSKAVGVTENTQASGIMNINFTKYGQKTTFTLNRIVTITHSYLRMKPIWSVFTAFQAIGDELRVGLPVNDR